MSHMKFDNGMTLKTDEEIKVDGEIMRIASAVIAIGQNDYVCRDITIHTSKNRMEIPVGVESTWIIDTSRSATIHAPRPTRLVETNRGEFIDMASTDD